MPKKSGGMPHPAQVIRRRRQSLAVRRGWAGLLRRVCVLLLGVWLLLSQVFLLSRADGLGMYPAIRDGDLVLAYRLQREFAKGDVIAYRQSDGVCLGRIVALETDVVMMDDSGSLLVNGSSQNSGILYPTYARENTVYPLRVQGGMVFVLGDYRTQTRDSRDHGPIPMDDILGKVITIVRRRGL